MAPGDATPPTTSADAQKAFDDGLNAHDRGDMAAAEASYRLALAADPRMAVAFNNLGMVLIQQNKMDEAVDSLRRASELDPDYAEAQNNLGFAFRRLGRNQEAAACYERFLALTPDVEDAPRIRDWIAGVRAAAISPPESEPAPAGVPVAEAEPMAEPVPPAAVPAAELPPEIGQPAEDLPVFATAASKPPAAIAPPPLPETAGEAVASADEPGDEVHSPARVPGLSERAEAEFADMFGKPDALAEAAAAPSAMTEEQTEELIGHIYTEAMTKFQDGDLGEAARLCASALEKAPRHYATLLLAGRVALSRQDYVRATSVLQAAIEVKGQDAEAQYFLGQCYEKRGLLDEAQEAYKKCVELAPDGARSKRLVAWLEQRRKDGKAAVGEVRCELCLRGFKESELELRDGKRVCRSCIETLGAKVQLAKAVDDKRAEKRPPVKPVARRRGVPGVVLVLLAVLVLLGAYVGLGVAKVVPLPKPLADLLLPKPPPRPQIRPVTPRVAAKAVPEEMSFAAPAGLTVQPLQALTIPSGLKVVWPGGKSEAPANADELRHELTAKPEGMLIDAVSGVISWTPGATAPVEVPSEHQVAVRATCGAKDVAATFKIRVAYDLGTPREVDLRLPEMYRATLSALAMGDLDGDGRPDLAASCGGPLGGHVCLMLSRGGTAEFNSVASWETQCAPLGLHFADADGDGHVDLSWTGWRDGKALVVKGTPGGQPARPVTAASLGGPAEAGAAGDFDGDGRADIAAAMRSPGVLRIVCARGAAAVDTAMPEGGATPRLFVLPGKGAGARAKLGAVFSGGNGPGRATICSLSDKAVSVESTIELPQGVISAAAGGDFDGDGKPGAALLMGGRSSAVTVIEGGGADGPSLLQPVPAGQLPIGLAAGDVNADGRDDVVISSPESLTLLLSTGKGGFVKAGEVRILGLAGPVAIWPSVDRSPARLAALSLKGRVWLLTAPAPPSPTLPVPASPPPAAGDEKPAAGADAPKKPGPRPAVRPRKEPPR